MILAAGCCVPNRDSLNRRSPRSSLMPESTSPQSKIKKKVSLTPPSLAFRPRTAAPSPRDPRRSNSSSAQCKCNACPSPSSSDLISRRLGTWSATLRRLEERRDDREERRLRAWSRLRGLDTYPVIGVPRPGPGMEEFYSHKSVGRHKCPPCGRTSIH